MIWFAIVVSTFIYAVIVYSLSRNWPQPGAFAESVQRPLVLGLYGAALAVYIAALIVPSYIAHHHQRFVFEIAMYDSCAIFGLVAAFITQDWRLFIAPWVLALSGFVRKFPSD